MQTRHANKLAHKVPKQVYTLSIAADLVNSHLSPLPQVILLESAIELGE
jgi:hypothetical protein